MAILWKCIVKGPSKLIMNGPSKLQTGPSKLQSGPSTLESENNFIHNFQGVGARSNFLPRLVIKRVKLKKSDRVVYLKCKVPVIKQDRISY